MGVVDDREAGEFSQVVVNCSPGTERHWGAGPRVPRGSFLDGVRRPQGSGSAASGTSPRETRTLAPARPLTQIPVPQGPGGLTAPEPIHVRPPVHGWHERRGWWRRALGWL